MMFDDLEFAKGELGTLKRMYDRSKSPIERTNLKSRIDDIESRMAVGAPETHSVPSDTRYVMVDKYAWYNPLLGHYKPDDKHLPNLECAKLYNSIEDARNDPPTNAHAYKIVRLVVEITECLT